jgi:hypothetical protein
MQQDLIKVRMNVIAKFQQHIVSDRIIYGY